MKKLFALLMAVLIAVACYNMPEMVSSAIPSAYYVTPDLKTYENVINCTGTVQSADVREIYLQSAVVPNKILAEVGDTVETGDLLVLVDTDMTEKMNTQTPDILREISGDLTAGQASSGIDWAALASSYGLSATQGDGQIDYEKLQSVLENGGAAQETFSSSSGAIAGSEVPDKIISPVSGVVTEVNIKPDAPASTGKSVFTIVDMTRFKVLAAVGESDIAKINIGDSAKVRGVGFSGSVYDGVVTKIYPTARKSLNNSDTVVDVEIMIENPNQRLKPGFSAKVEITGGNFYDLLTVPYEAIRQDENNDEYVYVYEDGKLKKQIVVTGQELINEVEILGGLDSGAVVVYNPGNFVKEGSMINIKGRADM